MESFKEHLSEVVAQQNAQGNLPDLGPDTEKLVAEMILEALKHFRGVPAEELIATIQSFRELSQLLSEAQQDETAPPEKQKRTACAVRFLFFKVGSSRTHPGS